MGRGNSKCKGLKIRVSWNICQTPRRPVWLKQSGHRRMDGEEEGVRRQRQEYKLVGIFVDLAFIYSVRDRHPLDDLEQRKYRILIII